MGTSFFVGQLQGKCVISFSLNCGTENKVWESEQRISKNNPHSRGNLFLEEFSLLSVLRTWWIVDEHSLPLCSWYSLHALWVHSKHCPTVQTLDVLKHTSEKKKGLYALLPWPFMIWVLIAFLFQGLRSLSHSHSSCVTASMSLSSHKYSHVCFLLIAAITLLQESC